MFMDCSSKQGYCLFDSEPDKISVLPGQIVSYDDRCKDFFHQDLRSCDVSLLNVHYIKCPVICVKNIHTCLHTYIHTCIPSNWNAHIVPFTNI